MGRGIKLCRFTPNADLLAVHLLTVVAFVRSHP